jgi:glycosyltransferase 2 family protein
MNSKITIQKVALICVILFIIAGAVVIALDWKAMRQVIGQADWLYIVPSLIFTGVSYLCLSVSQAIVFQVFGIKQDFKYLLTVGFVTNVISLLIHVGGAAGVSLQYVLLKKRGIATEDILAPSLFQLYFSGIALIALLPVSLLYILFSRQLSFGTVLGVSIAAGVLILLLVLASAIIFSERFRGALLRNVARAVHFIIRRDIANALNDFDNAMTRGVTIIRHHPRVLIPLILVAIGDWAGTAIALWFCFAALGIFMGAGTLITGFSLGITAGFVSMVPGGLGVQEGSLAGIYALFGIPIGTAVLAAILFRIVYYFVPFLVSLGFYRRLLRENASV